MKIIDLSVAIDASKWEPNPIEHEIMSPAEGARHMAEEMRLHFGVSFEAEALPNGELLSLDTLRLTTHSGTHVDAPSHYGSRTSYGTPRNIDQLPLDWFIGPGVVIDLTWAPVGAVGPESLREQFKRIGHVPSPGEIVLLHTGASRHYGSPRYFTDFTGLDGPATELLLGLGVRVIGTDAFSLDAPAGHMIAEHRRSRDQAVLWPAHLEGRRHEYCQIENLANLDQIPAGTAFTVHCLPVKIAGAGAGWTRAVALIDDTTDG